MERERSRLYGPQWRLLHFQDEKNKIVKDQFQGLHRVIAVIIVKHGYKGSFFAKNFICIVADIWHYCSKYCQSYQQSPKLSTNITWETFRVRGTLFTNEHNKGLLCKLDYGYQGKARLTITTYLLSPRQCNLPNGQFFGSIIFNISQKKFLLTILPGFC